MSSNQELQKYDEKIQIKSITKDIPESEIKVTKLKNGYTIEFQHYREVKKNGVLSSYKSNYFDKHIYDKEIEDIKSYFDEDNNYIVALKYKK